MRPIAFVNIPVTYMAVKWWRTMHQIQSTGESMDEALSSVLWLNTYAWLALMVWFLARRYRIAAAHGRAEAPPPLPEAQ